MRKLVPILLISLVFVASVGITTVQGDNQKNAFQELLKKTAKEKKIPPSVTIRRLHTKAHNPYPIVLVHGLAGWGRNEMLGFKYWGGLYDIERHLNKHGVLTYTAAVGTISSNWDRAVELYAEIKGGRVDYGLAHSLKHRHARFGRLYPGFYPQWGEENNQQKTNKIHLLGHSMGGQTIRLLDQLLMEGSADEQQITPHHELSPLFDGKAKSWISSITAIASPHNGSPFMYALKPVTPFLKKIISLVTSATGSTANPVYDFKLDQWGLKQKADESFTQFCERITTTLKNSDDLAENDLSPEGAYALNSWVKIHPDKYFFSVSAEQTYLDTTSGHYLPHPFMNPLFYWSSTYIGSFTQNIPGMVRIDSSWWANDGLVPLSSMEGPNTDPIVQFSTGPRKGKWNHLGTMHAYDHLDLIGIGVRDMRKWYLMLTELLTSLPAS